MIMFAPIALMILAPLANAPLQDSGHIEAILKSGDGKTEATAYKVGSVGEEYAVIRSFGFMPEEQALIEKSRNAWDRMTVTDPKTGQKIVLYFDISSFYFKDI